MFHKWLADHLSNETFQLQDIQIWNMYLEILRVFNKMVKLRLLTLRIEEKTKARVTRAWATPLNFLKMKHTPHP